MEKMIMIPESQYHKMLLAFDEAMKELQDIKKALASAETLTKAAESDSKTGKRF